MQFVLFLLVPALLTLVTRAAHVPPRRQELPVVVARTSRGSDLNNFPSGLSPGGHRMKKIQAQTPTNQTTITLPPEASLEAKTSQPQRRQFRNADFASRFPPTSNLESAAAGEQTSRPGQN
ncbi:hypothetical protein P691DRAFT_756137 [Macrolepiota fuliginosa MF-IS2]|uniref:Secreted protein n=1 Tax=Macrolepiota fuliginosa MF-IS2 TaxID=1400762 RepID=A0A9P6C5R0_9AGAR|nr:hypothetical protein P691DRAFT_756137 [Macrolepiota fuliginosa MF-IS2]